MPESKGRPKNRTGKAAPAPVAKKLGPNPPWFAPVMVALMVVGLLWVVTFYITQGDYPIGPLHYWNIAIGFALMLSGFAMTTRWR